MINRCKWVSGNFPGSKSGLRDLGHITNRVSTGLKKKKHSHSTVTGWERGHYMELWIKGSCGSQGAVDHMEL